MPQTDTPNVLDLRPEKPTRCYWCDEPLPDPKFGVWQHVGNNNYAHWPACP